jgi:hypothetical protein
VTRENYYLILDLTLVLIGFNSILSVFICQKYFGGNLRFADFIANLFSPSHCDFILNFRLWFQILAFELKNEFYFKIITLFIYKTYFLRFFQERFKVRVFSHKCEFKAFFIFFVERNTWIAKFVNLFFNKQSALLLFVFVVQEVFLFVLQIFNERKYVHGVFRHFFLSATYF